MKYQDIKKRICIEATQTRKLRDEARVLKQQSRTARKADKTTEANSLMVDALHLWGAANDDRESRRYTLLAYAYLRGRTYHQCENKCREGNEPDSHGIVAYAKAALEADGVKGTEAERKEIVARLWHHQTSLA